MGSATIGLDYNNSKMAISYLFFNSGGWQITIFHRLNECVRVFMVKAVVAIEENKVHVEYEEHKILS